MFFNYFRVFLTLLAALGAFFGYLCRLNLSLVIEEMVVKEVNPATEVAPSVQPVVVGPSAIDLNSRTEEQAFAFMSKGNWWIKQRAMLNQIKLSPKSRACKNRSSPIAPQIRATTRAPPIHVFAIEFDVSKSRRKGGGSSSNVASNNNNNNNAKGSDGSNGGSDGPPVAAPAAASASDKPAADGNANAVNELATTTTTTTTTTTPSPSESAPDVTGSCAEAPLLSWNKENRNDLLGAFFLGYVIFQVPAGRAAELLGPKLLLLCLGFGTGLSSLMFPYAARYSPDSIVFPYAIRVAMGASQAALFPASYVLLCNWLPKNERASWLAVPSSMGRFGTIAMNLVVPIIMLNYNWEWVFYTSGLVTIAWAILMVIFSSDRPSTSWWLSRDELIYIESRMEQPSGSTAANHPGGLASLPTNYDVGSTLSLDGKRPMVVSKPAIDWLKMLRNRALLILTVVMFSSEWSNMLLLVKLPGFLGPALNMPLEVVGYWSSALVLIYCVMYPLAGVLAARLEARLDSLRVRKIFEAMAHLFQASGCLMIAIFDHKAVVLSALVVMMIGRSLVGGGQCQMPPELSKDYPGTVLAVSNALANCAGIVGPMLLNFLVVDPTNYADWRSMWLFSAGVFIVCGILFCCLGDNRPQNYCKRPKLKKSHTTSLANLVLPAYVPPPLELPMDSQQQQSITKRRPPLAPSAPATTDSNLASDEIIRMGSFSRISSEPQPSRGQRRQRQQQQQQQKQQKQEHKADD